MRRRWIAAWTLSLVCVLALQAAQAASAGQISPATPSRILAELNAQRKLNGIPAGLQLRSDWTRACKKHDRYMAAHGQLTHNEVPGESWYTKQGAWGGRNAVISYGPSFIQTNPFEGAPMHLAQLLQPRLRGVGAFERHGANGYWDCVTTYPGFNRPLPKRNRIYTYPGNGAVGVSRDYLAAETPFTPNQIVGAPAHCGQELFVFVNGPALTHGWKANPFLFSVVHAALRPKGGQNVRLKIADGPSRTPQRFGGSQLGYYLGPGAAILIPVKPLRSHTTYVASVTMRGNGVRLKHRWSFMTG